MSSKKIGIVGWNTGDNSFGITKSYAEFFRMYGDVIILPPMKGILEGLDLLVLPGGPDVSPWLAKAVPSFRTSNNDVMKEFFFKNNLPQYIEAGVPIFGICLGMQQIAVHFGAKMIQHEYLLQSTESRSEQVDELKVINPRYNWLYERVTNKKNEEAKIYKWKVNSLHHQAVSPDDFPENELEVVAVQSVVKNIEVIKHRTLPIWGVQYHPEELVGFNYIDYATDQILKKLLTEVRQNEPAGLEEA